MARALVLSICVVLVCAGAALGRLDVYGWLSATGEVRVETWLTMGQDSIHRWLAVDGSVSDYGTWSYEDWDGAWATARQFTASGSIDSLNEIAVDLDADDGSLDLRAGSQLVGNGTVSVFDFNAIGDEWIRGNPEISGVAEPSMSFRVFAWASGENAPTDAYVSAWAKCVAESATAEHQVQFWVSQGESPVLDGGCDFVVSNEAFTVWGNPFIAPSTW